MMGEMGIARSDVGRGRPAIADKLRRDKPPLMRLNPTATLGQLRDRTAFCLGCPRSREAARMRPQNALPSREAPSTTEPAIFLTYAEVGRFLALSVRSVRRLLADGHLERV